MRKEAAQPSPQLATLADGELIDLTHPFDQTTIYWPTEDGFQLNRRAYGFTDTGYFYAANRIDTAEHGGTHIDAPIHFFQDRQTVDQIPLERLIGEAAIIDVRLKSRTVTIPGNTSRVTSVAT